VESLKLPKDYNLGNTMVFKIINLAASKHIMSLKNQSVPQNHGIFFPKAPKILCVQTWPELFARKPDPPSQNKTYSVNLLKRKENEKRSKFAINPDKKEAFW
jgi:hypothetical protein